MKREMIEIGTTIRVENGPARKTAIATEELLDDKVTASHYKVGLKDAMGKPIAIGEPMTYLDYKGELVWYVYQLEEIMIEDETIIRIAGAKGIPVDDLTREMVVEWFGVDPAHILEDPWRVMRFMPRGSHPSKGFALAAAKAMEE
jgi:hypothetical protein